MKRIPDTKVFNGKKYDFLKGYNTKEIADNIARQYKRQWLVRITKISYINSQGKKVPYYLLWFRKKG